MDWLQALILGLVQGLTEFLPVSSSGHIELGKAILGVDAESDITFTVIVHGATVLSTIVVFHKDIWNLLVGFFKFKWNEETQYLFKIAVSMVPVGIIGLLFEEQIEALFGENIFFVGCMLLLTAALLAFSHWFKPKKEGSVTFKDAFIIGIAQAIAVLPGVSRSGSTIATGLMLGNKKTEIARFSFLMVLIPIMGANVKKLIDGSLSIGQDGGAGTSSFVLLIGFLAAFFAGWAACSWMIKIVQRGKLIWFALYCLIVGVVAILVSII